MGAKEKLHNDLKGELIVSCQAEANSPLHGPEFMTAMAMSAEQGGAGGIRAEGIEDLQAIKRNVDLPLIGIIKTQEYDTEIYITPTLREVEKLVEANVDIIAFDATERTRPGDSDLNSLIGSIKSNGKISMADVSTYEEGIRAEEVGADIVATTLAGYTPYTSDKHGPQIELIERLAADLNIPVIAEGRIRKPDKAREAIEAGAHAVVVGSAITRPHKITRSFVSRIKSISHET